MHSDDPAYFGGYVNQNLVESCATLQLTVPEAYTLLRNSLESSFLEPSVIRRHVERLDEVFFTT